MVLTAPQSPIQRPLFETIRVTDLTGIAALAARGEEVDARNRVRYHHLPSRSLLNRATSRKPLPFVWTINPYRGCEVGCVYCYARYTHEYMGFDDPDEFERRIYVKQEAAELLERDLRRGIPAEEPIAIGTATDPYQPAERRFQVTRGLLEVFARHRDLTLSVTTKQELVMRDVDLMAEIADANRFRVNITLTTVDHQLARVLEPRASTPQGRLRTVERLAMAGIRVNINLMPILPGITDDAGDLERLFAQAKAAGAGRVSANVLFLSPSIIRKFYPFLERHSPKLYKAYRRAYGKASEAPENYRKRMGDLVERLRVQYELDGGPDWRADELSERAGWVQGDLFGGNTPARLPEGKACAG